MKPANQRVGKKQKKEVEQSPKDTFNSLIIESKNVQTVVLMLDSPEDDILLKACEAMYKFAEKGDENKLTLLTLGAIPKLTRLIAHEDKQIHKYATMTIGVMATHSEVRKSLRQLDFLPSIIACLAPDEDVVVQELATLCLASMSIDYTSKIEIFEKGGLGPLVSLLSSPDPDVQKNSIECISNLIQEVLVRAAFTEMTGIIPLLDLLSSEYPVIQHLTLQTLITMSRDSDSRTALFQNEGHENFLRVLDNPEFTDLHADILQVLANCLEEPDNVMYIRQSGALEKFLLFVTSSIHPEAQKHAVKAIARSALNRIFRLVPMLMSDNEELREAVNVAVANLTTDNSNNIDAVFDTKGVEPLVKSLHDSNDTIVASAATTITNLALQEHIRGSILSHGAMTMIVEPLRSNNTLVQSKAALVVASLACDVNGRTELRNAGGLEPLVELLHSDNNEVRRNACWAVLVCGKDEPTTHELCKLGALEILQEINQSSSRRNNFSEVAVSRLLDHNASLKYILNGYLSSNDIIGDGFYDPGRPKPNEKIFTLEEFSNQDLNQHRPILLINAKKTNEIQMAITSADDKVVEVLATASGRNVPSRLSSRDKSSSKGRSRGKKEEEKMKEGEMLQLKAEEEEKNKPWEAPYDVTFDSYIGEITRNILQLPSTRDQMVSLAFFVSDKMGGPVDLEMLHDFLWELHIAELKHELTSNIIPIGKIEKGIYYHRALLFKALADRIGINCSLVRGDYNRAWNEVMLIDPPSQDGIEHLIPPKAYIVDLMHQVGHLLMVDSAEAAHYKVCTGCNHRHCKCCKQISYRRVHIEENK
ncbi:armadillo repeat-containing protein 3 isoform X4 [Amblyraja radiata]|uniref:armadillo repeat-containing protein 3 isoform X4 n=1 Tax=Amblyraja radiata TaxID=386614 RepID=UPI001404030F|nr:armadillo repeat-containing protein 3 isoform X4 [Amblyraja radiata]